MPYATTYLALTQERMAQFCLFGLSALGKHVLLLPVDPALTSSVRLGSAKIRFVILQFDMLRTVVLRIGALQFNIL